jgi:WD40 repeat protein
VSDAPVSDLLEARGTWRATAAYVAACAFAPDGTAGFALGDGGLRLCRDAEWQSVAAHDGAVFALRPDPVRAGFLSAGDDGRVLRIGLDGAVAPFAQPGGWVEHLATHPGDKGRGLVAAASGRTVHLFDGAGAALKALAHPSTVSGIAFDPKGKRVAASHYGGASVWFVAAKTDTPRRLEWKGSHIGIVINPAGDHVVTAMQESALHGWRLTDGQHMRMTGYAAKTRSMGFSADGKWLATSGADSVVLWPFFGGGPMGKAPKELAGGDGVLCTAVAPHPQHAAVAAGFADGLVLLTDLESERILPVAAPGRGSISALAWSPTGGHLALGTETGFAAVVDFSRR